MVWDSGPKLYITKDPNNDLDSGKAIIKEIHPHDYSNNGSLPPEDLTRFKVPD